MAALLELFFLRFFYRPKSCGPIFDTACFSNFPAGFRPLGLSFTTNDFAFFGRGQLASIAAITLNIGLRYDYEQLPTLSATSSIRPCHRPDHSPATRTTWSPRWLAWWRYLLGDGKTLVQRDMASTMAASSIRRSTNALVNTGNPTPAVLHHQPDHQSEAVQLSQSSCSVVSQIVPLRPRRRLTPV